MSISPEVRDTWKRLYRFAKRHPSFEIGEHASRLASNLIRVEHTGAGLLMLAEQKDAFAAAVRSYRQI